MAGNFGAAAPFPGNIRMPSQEGAIKKSVSE
jgi:hypothetical protein